MVYVQIFASLTILIMPCGNIFKLGRLLAAHKIICNRTKHFCIIVFNQNHARRAGLCSHNLSLEAGFVRGLEVAKIHHIRLIPTEIIFRYLYRV